MEGHNARGVQLAHGEWYIDIDQPSKGSHECSMQMVFRTKSNALNETVWYKMWLITKEYSQVAGVDFNETFVPVAKFITITFILA